MKRFKLTTPQATLWLLILPAVLLLTTPPASLASAVVPEGCTAPITGSYLVMLDSQSSQLSISNRANQLAAAYGGTVERVFEYAFEGFQTTMSANDADLLASEPDVTLVEQNCRGEALSVLNATSGTQPNAPWALDRIDQRDLPLSTTYEYPGNGQGVHIYILDSGIRSGLPEFAGRVGNGVDVISVGSLNDFCNGHGTAVASAAAGADHGVAKGATLHPVVVLGCGSNDTSQGEATAGIEWVLQHHQTPAVINMSLLYGYSGPLSEAIHAAIDAGITFVTGAGNSPACIHGFALPQTIPEVITVAASNEFDQFTNFSSYGDDIDFIAPGENVLVSCPTAVPTCSSGCVPAGSNTSRCDGTSLAAPYTAGVAALHLEQNPLATPAMVEAALVGNASLGKISSMPPANQGCGATPNRLLYSSYLDNTPPNAVDDWFSTLWQTPITLSEGSLLANDSDNEGDPLSIVNYGAATHGGTVTATSGGVTYTPPPGCKVDSDSFTYTLSDGLDQTTATVHMSIGGIVCPPPNS